MRSTPRHGSVDARPAALISSHRFISLKSKAFCSVNIKLIMLAATLKENFPADFYERFSIKPVFLSLMNDLYINNRPNTQLFAIICIHSKRTDEQTNEGMNE